DRLIVDEGAIRDGSAGRRIVVFGTRLDRPSAAVSARGARQPASPVRLVADESAIADDEGRVIVDGGAVAHAEGIARRQRLTVDPAEGLVSKEIAITNGK